jgi:hypothetical protein
MQAPSPPHRPYGKGYLDRNVKNFSPWPWGQSLAGTASSGGIAASPNEPRRPSPTRGKGLQPHYVRRFQFRSNHDKPHEVSVPV